MKYCLKTGQNITSPEACLMETLFPSEYDNPSKVEVGSVVDVSYSYIKFDGVLILTKDVLIVEEKVVGKKVVPVLKHDYFQNFFDTETKKLCEEFSLPLELNYISPKNAKEISSFAINVFLSNDYVYTYLMENPLVIPKNSGFKNSKLIGKLYYLLVKNTPLAENIVKTNPNILVESFESLDVTSDVKSLKSAVGLPASVLDYLAEKKYNILIPFVQTLSDDGNDAVIIVDFLKSMKTFTKRKRDVVDFFGAILKNLSEIKIEQNSYKVVDMLRYILTQTMNHSNWTMDGLKEVCTFFKDYVQMKNQAGLYTEDNFPSNIREAHDLLMRNTKAIDKKDEPLFSDAVSAYKKLEATFEIKVGKDKVSYSVITPNEQKDLVIEGSKLHHCVGTYAKKIINKNTRVLFLRKTDEIDNPLVTLEVDSSNRVIQAKKCYNENVDGELEQAVKMYEKKIASIK